LPAWQVGSVSRLYACQLGRLAVSEYLAVSAGYTLGRLAVSYGQAKKLSVGQVVDELADKALKGN
jgi:hypothetical protein